jgi:hypothetical protein
MSTSQTSVSTSLHTFKIEVTPPVGGYLCGGEEMPTVGVETPLYLRGLIISTNGTRYVLACVDFCYLSGKSQRRFEEAIAAGAGVPTSQITLHSTHVHCAPLIDEELHAIIERYAPEVRFHDETYFLSVLDKSREAIRAVLAGPATPIGAVGYSNHPVHQFASTRRVIDDNNKCHTRFSVCADMAVRDKPEGFIDPLLDQIVFYDRDRHPVACMSSYACHPQVSAGRRLVSSETVGIALDLFEKTNPGVFPIYFTGCAGDVTAGKYTTANLDRNRLVFGVRLYDAVQAAFDKSRPKTLTTFGWADNTFDLPLREIDESEEQLIAIIRDPSVSPLYKYPPAMKLGQIGSDPATYPFRMTRVRLGHVSALFLPAELCVDYQIFAKQSCKGPLVVAAYGDSHLVYLATDEAFDQGGYEVNPDWTRVDKGIEPIIKSQITRFIGRAI